MWGAKAAGGLGFRDDRTVTARWLLDLEYGLGAEARGTQNRRVRGLGHVRLLQVSSDRPHGPRQALISPTEYSRGASMQLLQAPLYRRARCRLRTGRQPGRGGGECTTCSELRHALPPGGRGRVGACVLSAASQSSWVGGARVRAVASVVSDASRPHGQPARFLGPCDSPCKKTGVGLPCPPPGEPPDPGIEPASPEPPALQVGSLSLRHLGSPG